MRGAVGGAGKIRAHRAENLPVGGVHAYPRGTRFQGQDE